MKSITEPIYFEQNSRRSFAERLVGVTLMISGFILTFVVSPTTARALISGAILLICSLTLLAVADVRNDGPMTLKVASGLRTFPFLLLGIAVSWIWRTLRRR